MSQPEAAAPTGRSSILLDPSQVPARGTGRVQPTALLAVLPAQRMNMLAERMATEKDRRRSTCWRPDSSAVGVAPVLVREHGPNTRLRRRVKRCPHGSQLVDREPAAPFPRMGF